MNGQVELGTGTAAEFAEPVVKRRIPSQRNRDVFTQVLVRERSRTDVGKELGLSQPRVTQIIEQVQGWLTQVLGADGHDWTPEQRLRYAENATEMKLDYQCGEALEAWRKSLADRVQYKERHRVDGTLLWTEKITTTQCGKSSHLGLALRITLAQAKLAGVDVSGKSIRDAIAREQANAAQSQLKQEAVKPVPTQVAPQKPLCPPQAGPAVQALVNAEATAVNACHNSTCDAPPVAEQQPITTNDFVSNRYETGWEDGEKGAPVFSPHTSNQHQPDPAEATPWEESLEAGESAGELVAAGAATGG